MASFEVTQSELLRAADFTRLMIFAA